MITSELFTKRVRYLVAGCVVIFFIFGIRLVDVQAVQARGYAKRAVNEMVNKSIWLAPRGTITDVDGIVLARSEAAKNIIVDQTMIADPARTASVTAAALGLPEVELQTLLTGKKRYQVIENAVAPIIWDNLQSVIAQYNAKVEESPGGLSRRIVGFFSENAYTRNYPTGVLAASLVGLTNAANQGAAGIEASMNSVLSGSNGEYDYVNGDGAIIPGSQQFITAAKSGTDVRLTIERDIQWVAQDAISSAVKSAKAFSGTVIVMDPKTGAILAQASAPTFDPSKRNKITLDEMRNPAVQDVYEPGSTGKVITVSAALEEGTTTPTTVYRIPNTLKAGGRIFHDDKNHKVEELTTAGVLAVSSNIGAIQIGAAIPHDIFYSYLQKFGIGQSTGSNLPGESSGILHPVSQWSASSAPTMAFGQGYSLTAMQATDVFATIANDGVRVTPNVVAGLVDSNGTYTPSKPSSQTRVISALTAQTIRTMLEGVVSNEGTAPAAEIPGYQIAGKTGTAMRVDAKCGCYRGYTASFIGMAPAQAPQYVVSVVIQNPQGLHFGGEIAAPVFKKVMSFVLQSKQVQPIALKDHSYPLTQAALMMKTNVVVKP
ncbi:MAG TPA: penicillin-binding protein 2 [Candidatus Nanopelagicaceae bacterium]